MGIFDKKGEKEMSMAEKAAEAARQGKLFDTSEATIDAIRKGKKIDYSDMAKAAIVADYAAKQLKKKEEKVQERKYAPPAEKTEKGATKVRYDKAAARSMAEWNKRMELEREKENKKASWFSRVIAFVIDYLLICFVEAVFLLAFIMLSFLSTWITTIGVLLFIPFVIILFILYFALFESSKYQASPGKMLLHVKVEGQNGQKISLKRALWRACLKFVLWNIGGLGINTLAGTEVVKAEAASKKKNVR